jgi:hypothetical protein
MNSSRQFPFGPALTFFRLLKNLLKVVRKSFTKSISLIARTISKLFKFLSQNGIAGPLLPAVDPPAALLRPAIDFQR